MIKLSLVGRGGFTGSGVGVTATAKREPAKTNSAHTTTIRRQAILIALYDKVRQDVAGNFVEPFSSAQNNLNRVEVEGRTHVWRRVGSSRATWFSTVLGSIDSGNRYKSSVPEKPPDRLNVFLGPAPIPIGRIPLRFGDQSPPQPVQQRLLGDADQLRHLSSCEILRFALPGFCLVTFCLSRGPPVQCVPFQSGAPPQPNR